MKIVAKVVESMLTSTVTQRWTGQTCAVPSRGVWSCGVWSWGGADGTSTIF